MPNTGAREILITYIMQNQPVASHLAIKSQSPDTDRCGSLYFVDLIKLELIFTESSSLNCSESELAKEEFAQDLKGGRKTVAITLGRSFQSNMVKDNHR